MTQRQWLQRERQPEYSGINARLMLKVMVSPRGRRIDRAIALNAISAAARALSRALGA